MTPEPLDHEQRNKRVLAGQSVVSKMAWTLGSPSIVLPFLAISLEMPMFLAGLLIAVRKVGGMLCDVFLADTIAAMGHKKNLVAVTELALASCLMVAVAAAAFGSVTMIAVAFVCVFFCFGFTEETQSLLFTDLIGDYLSSKSRMQLSYLQLGAGGLGAIALTLVLHELTKQNPPFSRHTVVIVASVVFFLLSGFLILRLTEFAGSAKQDRVQGNSPGRILSSFVSDARQLYQENWFRTYLLMRLPLVVVALSVPFFALITAEAHHGSASGLTALIVSSAAGFLISAPLWRMVNMKSHRAVMISGTLMVAVSGSALIALHFLGLDHIVHLHGAALLVATIAATGISNARKLYFWDVAPKEQRVKSSAVIKSLSRLTAVITATSLAAIAHVSSISASVLVIVVVSLISAYICFRLVPPAHTQEAHAS